MNQEARHVFRPRARLLTMLGDQLIRDPGIAVFELVKNAYDADAQEAIVEFSNIQDPGNRTISIQDDGVGMDWQTVTGVWMEPGTDYRQQQRESGLLSPRFRRLPLGEKGIGRFAIHKLGTEIELITRKEGEDEIVVNINWKDFEKSKYLEESEVEIRTRAPEVFKGDATGTRLEVSDLKSDWTRGDIRELSRSMTSICSPFAGPEKFRPILKLDPDPGWLKGLLTVDEVLERSLFRAHCALAGNSLTYDYEFVPYPEMERVEGRKVESRTMKFGLKEGDPINLAGWSIGPIEMDLHIYDRDPSILKFGITDKKGLKDFLNQNGGVRVYRDGIRIYDYGEPGNDWLGLDWARVNIPTQRISRNIVLGAAELRLSESTDLVEKTNREGFVETPAAQAFRDAVAYAVQQITFERNLDKARIRAAYSSSRLREPVVEALAKLRDEVEKRGLTSELSEYIDGIEKDFVEIRDRLLTAAGAGLSLSVVIHEVEKGVAELRLAVERESTTLHIKKLATHLSELIQGLTYLTRKSGKVQEDASDLISQAVFNTSYRLEYHHIKMLAPTPPAFDFRMKCHRRLIIASLMNLIDNSIYWVDTRWSSGSPEGSKFLYIGASNELPEGPAIVVGDNGPGFIDAPEYLIEPFMSRKPDGMGLGLHVADQVLKSHNGRLIFPEVGDLALPSQIDGAVVALVFPKVSS